MNHAVVDTNVLLVAEQMHADAAMECVTRCIEFLDQLQRGDELRLTVDYDYRILGEYRNKLPRGSSTERMLNELQLRGSYLAVHITEAEYPEGPRPGEWFAEIPAGLGFERFDPSDRKLVAVAIVARQSFESVAIINAADSDWQDVADSLSKCRIQLTELCENDSDGSPARPRQVSKDSPPVPTRKQRVARRQARRR